MDATATTNRAVERIVTFVRDEAKRLVQGAVDEPDVFRFQRLEEESIESSRRIGRLMLETLSGIRSGYQGRFIPGHSDVGDGQHRLENKGPRKRRSLKTCLGEISYSRSYYHSSNPSDSRWPRDEELGLSPGQRMSSALVESLNFASVTTGSYDQGVKTVAKFTGVQVEYKQAQRECLKVGEQLEKEAIEAAHRVFDEGQCLEEDRKNIPEAIIASVDGITVEHCAGGGMEIKVGRVYRASPQAPRKASKARRRKKRRKRAKSRADDKKREKEVAALKESREQREYQAATGLVKTALDRAAPERKTLPQYRPSSEKSSYCASSRLGTELFGQELWLAAQKLGAELATAVIFLADGSHWCWNICQTHFCKAVQILDIFHLARNVIAAANGMWGERSSKAKRWRNKMMVRLIRGEVGKIIEELTTLSFLDKRRCQAKASLISYLKNNQGRMNYPDYIKKGFPISSAMIEGACRHVIGSRMKGSGRRWDDDGADAMARLRALYCGGEWEAFHVKKQRERECAARTRLKAA